jgi:hypothetical protein
VAAFNPKRMVAFPWKQLKFTPKKWRLMSYINTFARFFVQMTGRMLYRQQ